LSEVIYRVSVTPIVFLRSLFYKLTMTPFQPLEFCHLKQTICAFRRQWWTTMDGRIKMQISP